MEFQPEVRRRSTSSHLRNSVRFLPGLAEGSPVCEKFWANITFHVFPLFHRGRDGIGPALSPEQDALGISSRSPL